MNQPRVAALRQALSSAQPQTAQALAQALGVSQPTLSRELLGLGDEVVRLGRARRSTYLGARPIGRWGARWPLYRIDAVGKAHELGQLVAAGRQGFALQTAEPLPGYMHGPFESGWFDALPWFMAQTSAHPWAQQPFNTPTTNATLPDDDVVAAWISHGHNLPGDLVLGRPALEKAMAGLLAPQGAIPTGECAQHYPAMALAALQTDRIAHTTDGDQPHFHAVLRQDDGTHHACIVKFSDRQTTPTGRRWADLLRCQHRASQALQSLGVPVATTELMEADGRCFLSVARVDRTADLGRRGMVSLRALGQTLGGAGPTKPGWELAPQWLREGWIDPRGANAMTLSALFAALIGHVAPHDGHLALLTRPVLPWALAPSGPMWPRHWAPQSSGEITHRPAPSLLPPTPDMHNAWHLAAAAALRFWREVQADEAMSDPIRALARESHQVLRVVAARLA